MKRLLVITAFLGLLWAGSACAQELLPTVWQNYIELIAEDDEETVDELMELYDNCHDNPLNLNDTVNPLPELPFVSALQREYLRSYILQYGSLRSVEELYGINGFDSLTVELLRPIVSTASAEDTGPTTLGRILKYGRHNLVTGCSGTVEEARGYRDSIYAGDNLRIMWRYSFKYKDMVQLQLSGDKDPGEAFFGERQPQGFDFYGYSLMLKNIGLTNSQWDAHRQRWSRSTFGIRKLVVGQYHAQFGQGLTLWSGFTSRTPLGTSISRYAQGFRPSGAFSEYGYLRGAATTLALTRRWDLSMFYSYVQRDATLPRKAAKDSTITWVQSLYNSGYHRTETEIKKRNQLDEHLFGGHLEYHNDMLRVGLTGVSMILNKDMIPATYVYNDNAFQGGHNFNAGVDAAFRYKHWLLFGEAAACINHYNDSTAPNISPAAIVGTEFIVNSNHRVSALFRHYSPTYHNLHACAVGQNGTPQNETGGGIYYQGLLPLSVTATLSADWAQFPHMKYLVYDSSHAAEYRVMLSRPSAFIRGLKVNVRYRYKERERNITPSRKVDGHYLLENTYRHQIQGDIEYSVGPWKLVSRLAYAHYRGDVTQPDYGLLFYQDIQYRPTSIPLTVATRIALFDVDDYEARLYTVESDFIYQYNTSSFLNEGYRFYLLLRYDISTHWNIGIKYAITAYSDRDNFGSSYELIDANHRQQWRIQMRLKW